MNNDSGVNTILLVAILALLVAGGVWFFNRQSTPDDGATINVTLPTGNEEAAQ